MKKLLILAALGSIIVLIGVPLEEKQHTPKPPNQVVCSMEAKLCPDGSAVGRVGPRCEFAACPGEESSNSNSNAVIEGKVSVGPICPVERVGVPCPVPPEAYTSREVALYSEDGSVMLGAMYFNPDGTYRFRVPPGTYVLKVLGTGIGSSKDLPKTVSVTAGETVKVNFSIDTGIR